MLGKELLMLFAGPARLATAMTTLFNGLQSTIFPITTSASCLASFNTSIDCDPLISYLYKQTDWVGWNATNLTALVSSTSKARCAIANMITRLCTSECRQSLANLKETVVPSCQELSFPLGGATIDAEKILDFYMYKYNLTCLSDGSSWCLLEERKWFVEYLPTVTWPSYTEKWYPDWISQLYRVLCYAK